MSLASASISSLRKQLVAGDITAVDIVDARGRSPLAEASSLVGGQPIPGADKVVEILRAASAAPAF